MAGLSLGVASFAILLAGVSGCERKQKAAKSPSATAGLPASGPVAHPGSISGQVFFAGTAPKLPPLDLSSVPDCAKHHPSGLPDESVIINTNGTLKNVVVYLKSARGSPAQSNSPPVLDQLNCQYVPHVVAVQLGQPLLIKSSDPFLHNVHAADAQPPINLAFIGAQQRQVIFQSPGCFTVRCDVHPWMKAVICVLDSSCFAVTDDQGRFQIANIPPGNYTLILHHERFGDLSEPVDIPPDATMQRDMIYR